MGHFPDPLIQGGYHFPTSIFSETDALPKSPSSCRDRAAIWAIRPSRLRAVTWRVADRPGINYDSFGRGAAPVQD